MVLSVGRIVQTHEGVNPAGRWSGEARRPVFKPGVRRDHYLDADELANRVFIVGRLVETPDGWFLEPIGGAE